MSIMKIHLRIIPPLRDPYHVDTSSPEENRRFWGGFIGGGLGIIVGGVMRNHILGEFYQSEGIVESLKDGFFYIVLPMVAGIGLGVIAGETLNAIHRRAERKAEGKEESSNRESTFWGLEGEMNLLQDKIETNQKLIQAGGLGYTWTALYENEIGEYRARISQLKQEIEERDSN